MKAKRVLHIFIVIIIGILFSGCSIKPMIETNTFGSMESRERLLIASRDSEFKDKILADILKEFEPRGLFIEVIDLENLSKKIGRNYQAIVLINEYRMFQVDNRVNEFVNGISEEERSKIVLLTTAGDPKNVKDIPEVDAISSASELVNSGTISEEIITRVNAILLRH